MNGEKVSLASVRNTQRRTVKTESEKINQVLPYISTNNITELNELIYTGVKLVCEKIGIPPPKKKHKKINGNAEKNVRKQTQKDKIKERC